MNNTPPEAAIAFLLTPILWAAVVATIYWLRGRWRAAGDLWPRMGEARWAALGIALVYLVSAAIAARLDPGKLFGALVYSIAIFAAALIGLALARRVSGRDPLPVVRAVRERRSPVAAVLLMVVWALGAGVVAFLVGNVAQGVALSMTGETPATREAVAMLPADKWLSFFSFLSGAGLAEETPYRLVMVPLFWGLTGRRWLGILCGALVFAAYHLTPLNTMYLYWWQFPVAMFISTVAIGCVWGWLFVRRGFETTVLAHTLQNWVSVMLFM